MKFAPERIFVSWILLAVSCSGADKADTRSQPAVVFASRIDEEGIQKKRKHYRDVLRNLENGRRDWAKNWSGKTKGEQATLIAKVRDTILTVMLEDLFPAWYGTGWDFNGVSQTPGEGKIACGYFVTTCLRDAGFDLPRIKLAQQPSQTIIRTLADPEQVKLLYDKPMSEIEEHLRESGPGLFIVGLDQHTGFVVNDGSNLAFIHSSYFDPPFAVTSEPVDSWNPLAKSKYRVFGKILGDEMIRKWILGEKFEMK